MKAVIRLFGILPIYRGESFYPSDNWRQRIRWPFRYLCTIRFYSEGIEIAEALRALLHGRRKGQP